MPATTAIKITVDLANNVGDGLSQMECEFDIGEHDITWEIPQTHKQFRFADPPLTFHGCGALPFELLDFKQQVVTYRNHNANFTKVPISYQYQIHLIFGNFIITYPYLNAGSSRTEGDPCIRNKPK